jgi:hypothetical protein
VKAFKKDRKADLTALMLHFESKAWQHPKELVPYNNFDALMADMLDDVIDVWLDAHLKGNDDCDEL